MEIDAKASALDNLANGIFPREMWLEIFPYLSVRSILNCLRACKAFEYYYLAPLSAKRNFFIVGRVIRYGEQSFDQYTDKVTMHKFMDVAIGYGSIAEMSKLCFASCTLIVIPATRYKSALGVYPFLQASWDLPRVIRNTYIAMGSPNIIACYTDVNNDNTDQAAYERFEEEIKNAARSVLGRNFEYFKTIPLPKKFSMNNNKMVEWYKGPTLSNLIGQSNQFLPQLTLRQALAKPDYIRYEERHTQLCMTTAGVTESTSSHIKCPIMPYMPWIGPLRADDPKYYTNDSSPSLVHFPSMSRSRPGNCLVSIAVLQNTLRTHFENEIFILGLKRYIHVHLLLEIKEGKVNFLDQVFPGENCMAIATISAEKIVTYKQPDDPKLKSAYGKFVANDHATEVFYGIVLKFNKDHSGDFFEGDIPSAYHRENVVRQRRREVILAKEANRRARIKAERIKRKEGKKAAKEFVELARDLNLMK